MHFIACSEMTRLDIIPLKLQISVELSKKVAKKFCCGTHPNPCPAGVHKMISTVKREQGK